MKPGTSKFSNVMTVDEKTETGSERNKCPLGCEDNHRFVDCKLYTEMTPEKRRNAIRDLSRCYICLGNYHTARYCSRKKERKCNNCLGESHHWSLCYKPKEVSQLNALVSPFNGNTTEPLDQVEDEAKQFNSANISQDDVINTDKADMKSSDYAPLVLAEVETGEGKWRKIKCFLDTGSNASLIRLRFAKLNNIHSNGTCTVKFGTAGGGVHNEKAEEFEMKIRPFGEINSHVITATGIKKPCSSVKPVTEDVFKRHRHLHEFREDICWRGRDRSPSRFRLCSSHYSQKTP